MGNLLKKFKSGSVSATIWENSGQPGPDGQPKNYKTVTVNRSYKDNNQQWKDTNSFRLSDLYDVEIVSRAAYEFLRLSEPQMNMSGTAASTSVPPQQPTAPAPGYQGPQQQFPPQQ